MTAPIGDERARLLVVCTGNIARSPLAAALLREEIRLRSLADWVRVDSAGTHARAGNPAVDGSKKAAAKLGVSLAEHSAQPVTEELVAAADLTLTMTEAQRSFVVGKRGGLLREVFTLREFVRLSGAGPPGEAGGPRRFVQGVAAAAHRRRPRHAPEESPEDVADPFGRSQEAFTEMAETLTELTGELAVVLLGERRLF